MAAGGSPEAVDLEDARDYRWLLARARGEDVQHPDPERATAYSRLEEALGALPVQNTPVGWQRRVLAAIAEGPRLHVVGPGIDRMVPGSVADTFEAIRDVVLKAYGDGHLPKWPDPEKSIIHVTCDGYPYAIHRKGDGFTVRQVQPNEIEP